MSNSLVGTVYQKIMEEVIEGCVVTFEEEGVERSLLDECKKAWQAKLSDRSVALMPWDPAPMVAQPMPAAPPVGRQPPPNQAPVPVGPLPMQAGRPINGVGGGVQVKSEPGAEYDLVNLHQSNPAPYERLQQNLSNRFGQQASTQISQVQAKAALHAQSAPGQQGQRPPTAEELQKLREKHLRDQQMAGHQSNQTQQQQHQSYQLQMSQQMQQQRNAVGNSQTDGAGDWNTMVAERRAAALAGGSAADSTIMQRIEQMSQDMEGGGLLQPMSQLSKQRKSKPSRPANSNADTLVAGQIQPSTSKLCQMDGGDETDDDKADIKDDDDEDDEDAINSDLDDPDDDQPEETEEEANNGEFMLCTYDKVQRVKNKWKCTLKDGVLATGGKEYVFHKAQGEFEW